MVFIAEIQSPKYGAIFARCLDFELPLVPQSRWVESELVIAHRGAVPPQ